MTQNEHLVKPQQRVSIGTNEGHFGPKSMGTVETVYFGLETGTPYAIVLVDVCKEQHMFKQSDLEPLEDTKTVP